MRNRGFRIYAFAKNSGGDCRRRTLNTPWNGDGAWEMVTKCPHDLTLIESAVMGYANPGISNTGSVPTLHEHATVQFWESVN